MRCRLRHWLFGCSRCRWLSTNVRDAPTRDGSGSTHDGVARAAERNLRLVRKPGVSLGAPRGVGPQAVCHRGTAGRLDRARHVPTRSNPHRRGRWHRSGVWFRMGGRSLGALALRDAHGDCRRSASSQHRGKASAFGEGSLLPYFGCSFRLGRVCSGISRTTGPSASESRRACASRRPGIQAMASLTAPGPRSAAIPWLSPVHWSYSCRATKLES